MRLAQLVPLAILLIPRIAISETIVTPQHDDAWTCPGTHAFYATGCDASSNSYVVKVRYFNNSSQLTELHTQGCSADANDVIDISLNITATPDCGRHDGEVVLYKIVYTPTPKLQWVAAKTIYIDGPTCP